jgi:hypothetical protein
MTGVTARRRGPARLVVSLQALLLTLVAFAVAACGQPGTQPAASGSASTGPTSRTGPDLTPVPGGASAAPTPFASIKVGPDRPDITDVEGFGAIRDRLPASFPRLDGQEPADGADVEGATSGSFAVNQTADGAAAAMATRLQRAGWSVEVGSPLEDGTVVLEADGPAAGCRTEVRFTPKTGSVVMSVLYGASCPAS